MKKVILQLMLAPLLMFSCEENIPEGECGPYAIITNTAEDFDAAVSDPFTIISAVVEGNCLSIQIGASGCDGESWTAQLLVSPLVAESLPPQAGLKLVLDNPEACQAVFQRTFTFDVQSLKEISEEVIIRLEGYDPVLRYPTINPEEVLGEWYLMNINGGLAGIDSRFNKGDIIWDFSKEEVIISNGTQDPNQISGLESGTYAYSIMDSESWGNILLNVNGQSLGAFTHLSADSMVVDMRAADGFQYVWLKFD